MCIRDSRKGKPVQPEGNTVIEVDDEVFFLADRRNILTVMSELRKVDARPARRLLIAGGGNIGRNLARSLESRYSVKVLERSRERARGIAEDLLNSIVLVGDCADEDLLREENIDQTDVYCAMTNDDEANILSAMRGVSLVSLVGPVLSARNSWVPPILSIGRIATARITMPMPPRNCSSWR